MRKDAHSTANIGIPLLTASSLIYYYAALEIILDETHTLAVQDAMKKAMEVTTDASNSYGENVIPTITFSDAVSVLR